jgi:hypothetical protein
MTQGVEEVGWTGMVLMVSHKGEGEKGREYIASSRFTHPLFQAAGHAHMQTCIQEGTQENIERPRGRKKKPSKNSL